MKTHLDMKSPDFKHWLLDLKLRIRQSQIKAMIRVNEEMLHLYWDLGRDIVVRQMDAAWGSGFFKQLSKELKAEFPDMQGFSERNLYNMKQFYLFYSQDEKILQQVVAKLEAENLHQLSEKSENAILHQLGAKLQHDENKENIILHQLDAKLEDENFHQVGGKLEDENIIRQQVVDELKVHPIFQIPWRHHIEIFTKSKSVKEALFYVQKTIQNGWSRAMLMNFIETDLYQRQGKSVNNFDRFLPDVQSDLAKEIMKDLFNFNWLRLTENYKEKELEGALVDNIAKFLLELGHGFAYVGRQYPIQVGNRERNIDLLFYHLELRCYVVIELKVKEFEPEYTGKLGYYIAAINNQLKKDVDNPTIGLLIVKQKDNIDVQYSLESSSQPIGVSEYTLSKLLPENFKSALPSIEEIERELNKSKI